jgi:hypothetical protein
METARRELPELPQLPNVRISTKLPSVSWHDMLTPSQFVLILVNIVVVYIAITNKWSVLQVMWLYWMQSVIIGIFHCAQVLRLNAVSTKDVKVNGVPLEESPQVPLYATLFFIVHYGMFHLVYALFLYDGFTEAGAVDLHQVFLYSGLFFLECLFTYVMYPPSPTYKPNIGRIMIVPYARIIPMHLTILFMPLFSVVALPFFLMLKTGADIVTHATERMLFADTVQGGDT